MPPVFSMFSCGPIFPEKIVLTGVVTLVSGIQLIYFARRVYKSREKHNIQFPATTGHPEFERTFRAQQNVLEWNPIFMGTLWTTTLFLHQVPAAICGVLYLICRHRYFNGYCRSVEERLPGFYMGARVLMVMLVMSAVGIGRTVVSLFYHRHHFHHGMGLAWRGGKGWGEALGGWGCGGGCSGSSRIPLPQGHDHFHHHH